jgi:ubiquinone/menaquinone biosynthesis C-methylase UbiE
LACLNYDCLFPDTRGALLTNKKQPAGSLAAVSGEEIVVNAKDHYDDWANSYEHDLLNEYGYIAHDLASAAMEKIVADKTASILDLGCGTGLVGQALTDKGYTEIDGVDFSEKMLNIARQRKIYKQLYQADLTCKTELGTSKYDATICAGLFGAGHLGPEGLLELIRVTKPGGSIVILMNEVPYLHEHYESHLKQLADQSLWTIQSNDRFNYMNELDRPGRLITAIKNSEN